LGKVSFLGGSAKVSHYRAIKAKLRQIVPEYTPQEADSVLE
jgi:hypothetical protein